MAGYLSLQDQDCQIIFFNIVVQCWTLSYGLQTAGCTLIGNQIGNGNVREAKRYYREILKFCFAIFVAYISFVWIYQVEIFNLFTKSDNLREMRPKIFWSVFLVLIFDYWVSVFSGIIRAIGKQGIFCILNFIAYYVIIVPVSFLLAFKVGSHIPPAASLSGKEEELVSEVGLGQNGMWLAFLVGFTHLLVAQILVINVCSNWDQIAAEAAERMAMENDGDEHEDEEFKQTK